MKLSPTRRLRRIGAAEVRAFPLAIGGTAIATAALLVILLFNLGTLPRDVALAATGIGLLGSVWGRRFDKHHSASKP